MIKVIHPLKHVLIGWMLSTCFLGLAQTPVVQTIEQESFLLWEHNIGSTLATNPIVKDFGKGTALGITVNATPIEKIWQVIVTDPVSAIKLSIPKTMVASTVSEGGTYIMIVADDDTFTTNVTSVTMKEVDTNLEVDCYLEGTKYITFGSAQELNLGSRSLHFNGSEGYITAGNVNDLAHTDYTISAWVKRDSTALDIVSKRNDFFHNDTFEAEILSQGYALKINQDGKFSMTWKNAEDTANNVLKSEVSIPNQEWHHVAVSYNSKTNMASLYVDGLLEDYNNTLNPINASSHAPFIIGATPYNALQQKVKGNIDEVRIWNIALSADQIRYIMNQEITKDQVLGIDYVVGKELPSILSKNEIQQIPWDNLVGYYPMSNIIFGSLKDESNNGNDLSLINFDGIDYQTAPLPYKTKQAGNWDDSNTWQNGDVQYLPGTNSYANTHETIDYNIVEINHNLILENSDPNFIPVNKNDNRTVLGLKINSDATLTLNGDNALKTGNAITVTHYLKLDGNIDLEGESQLVQTEGSYLDPTSSGTLQRDQQGTKDVYTYNYWSSPVGFSNSSTNNNAFRLSNNLMKNGTISATPNNITFSRSGYNGNISGNNITIADYWIWKYGNRLSDDFSSWQHIRSNGLLQVGEGFTMKGVEDTGGNISLTQNYVFEGKPNNGDISITINAGSDYLVGNPYPSALDADAFIKDNISFVDSNGEEKGVNVINGALYFWDHFAPNSHYLIEYQGGYATYTLMGGTVAVNNDTRIHINGTSGTKIPQRYIPVGQGFFVSANPNTNLVSQSSNTITPNTVVGGTLQFKNSQRVFEKEGASSIFLKAPSNSKSAILAKTDRRKKIKLMFDSPQGYHRQLLIGEDEHATYGIDLGYDGYLIENNKEDIYWNIAESKFTIQAINSFDTEKPLPLGLKIDKDGLTTIKIDALENIPNEQEIFLHDKELNTYHNLKTSAYQIYLNPNTYSNRFELAFSNTTTLDIDVQKEKNIQMHFSNEKSSFIIQNPHAIPLHAFEVYNILGQSVLHVTNLPKEKYFEIKSKLLAAGSYIIRFQTHEQYYIKKILIN
ncbi:T9SS type A sorting domain-containing protein [Tamlana fucoidanivorans]|uniref:T9SS type A sorting domain-containing protein n=1 Tax=Allotamlana fucoidanivorans TaxID=2583814 RepID=A0A5C4SPE7_9FLAO|nr:LamG-like jellyroll fold domain-containing protein [Tamlana fucoidanivorans]TNJ45683.1 T9SS type A sorting domain-containing protein [Tamlana fucoidanivorans]